MLVPKFTATIWQLQVLADLAMTRLAERIGNAVDLWFDLHIARDGGFTPWSRLEGKEYRRIHFRHRDRFMKKGHLCTTGNMVRSLIRFGYLADKRVRSAIDWLVDEQHEDGGWDCFGRPKGTLDAWEAMSAFAEIPRNRRSSDVKRAIERARSSSSSEGSCTRATASTDGGGSGTRGTTITTCSSASTS